MEEAVILEPSITQCLPKIPRMPDPLSMPSLLLSTSCNEPAAAFGRHAHRQTRREEKWMSCRDVQYLNQNLVVNLVGKKSHHTPQAGETQ